MALFNRFPYTNGHELNLDWIIKMVKKLPTKVSQLINDAGYLTMDTVPVKSVNNQTGNVYVASIDDVNAINDKIGRSISAIGNPASFYTEDPNGSFTKLLVSMEPVQSGSGDPSPTNVRPIAGFTGLDLWNDGSETSYSVAFPTAAGTVCGGTLDLVTGELTVEKFSKTWVWSEGVSEYAPPDNSFKRRTFPLAVTAVAGAAYSITNCIAAYNTGIPTTAPYFYLHPNGRYFYAWLPTDTDSNFEIQLCGTLAEPHTYFITAPQIEAITGANSLSVNNGASIELTFTTGINGLISNIANTRPIIKIGTITPSTSFINSGELYLMCNTNTCELYFNDNNVIKQIT